MGKYLYSFFKQIDIFGVSPRFTIRGNPSFQSQIGSFLTIICIFLIFIYLSVLLNQMINHKSPVLHSTIYYDEKAPEIYLTKYNFSFVFGLQTKDYKNYIDESIYKVNAYQSKLILNQSGIYQLEKYPLPIIKCDKFHFNIIPDKFKRLPLGNLYCLHNNISLKGDYMQDSWNFIKIHFLKCENSTNKDFCKSEEEIDKVLNSGFVGMFFPNSTFESKKLMKPYSTYIRNLYEAFSIKYYQDIFIYFKLLEVITDLGYFFENNKIIYLASYDYIQNEIDFERGKNILSISIGVSSKRESYKRSYIKLQEICSKVGGMVKIILLIGEYSIYFIRITLYKNYILEFFNLDESEIRLKKIRKKYHLPEHHISKNKLFADLSNKNNYNFKKKNYKIDKKIKFQLEDKLDNKSDNQDESPIINKESREIIQVDDKNNSLKNNFLKGDLLDQINFKNYSKFASTFIMKNSKNNLNYLKDNEIYKTKSNASNKNMNLNTNKNCLSSNSVIKKSNGNLKKYIFIPKTQLRIIKVPGFFTDFVCKKNTFQTIKQVHENYREIQFLLDIVHYLKSQNELNIIGKYLFSEEQRKTLSHTYTFEADFGLERKGYDYMIKHKKNKFDEKDKRETSQNNLLSVINKKNYEIKT